MTKKRLGLAILLVALAGVLWWYLTPLPIKELMAQRVQPTAQTYWDAVRFVSDETGDHDIRPRTDAEWEKTRKAAADLAAFGEQLKTEPYTEGRAADWTQFAQALVDVSKLAEQAAAAKDADKVFEVGGTVYSVCSACHQVYPPSATPASGTPQ
jgi:hypothetical protein